MKISNIPFHDIHVHTHLSLCSDDETATVENYLTRAKELGIEVLGISDHMWDSKNIPIKNQFYFPQSFERQLARKNEFPKVIDGIRLLWGCETEYANGVLGITEETAKKLDYVLVPHSHLHMKGFVRPSQGIDTPKEIAKFMLHTFKGAVNTGLATGIAHPFDPCFFYENLQEIFSYLSDDEFQECFIIAKQKNVSIEINISSFDGDIRNGVRSACYLRMFEIAKKVGCKFHFGSDTHSIRFLERINKDDILYLIEYLSLSEADILSII